MNFKEQEEKYLDEHIKYIRKSIMIDNWDEFDGWSKNKKRKFLNFFYDNLDDMNYSEALDAFKGLTIS